MGHLYWSICSASHVYVAMSLLSFPTSKRTSTSSFIHSIASRINNFKTVNKCMRNLQWNPNMPGQILISLGTFHPKSPFSSSTLPESNESGGFEIVAQRNLLLSLVTFTIAVLWNIGKVLQNFMGDRKKKKPNRLILLRPGVKAYSFDKCCNCSWATSNYKKI